MKGSCFLHPKAKEMPSSHKTKTAPTGSEACCQGMDLYIAAHPVGCADGSCPNSRDRWDRDRPHDGGQAVPPTSDLPLLLDEAHQIADGVALRLGFWHDGCSGSATRICQATAFTSLKPTEWVTRTDKCTNPKNMIDSHSKWAWNLHRFL